LNEISGTNQTGRLSVKFSLKPKLAICKAVEMKVQADGNDKPRKPGERFAMSLFFGHPSFLCGSSSFV